MSELLNSLIELIRRTSAEIPDDVHKAILTSSTAFTKSRARVSTPRFTEKWIFRF